jgi:hypothetical protein
MVDFYSKKSAINLKTRFEGLENLQNGWIGALVNLEMTDAILSYYIVSTLRYILMRAVYNFIRRCTLKSEVIQLIYS